MILFDTNIFIEVYRNNDRITNIVKSFFHNNVAICDVVCAELYFGALNKQELKDIAKNLDTFMCFPITPEISNMAVKFVKQYCLSHKLQFPDALIAATALFHHTELFTLNKKDFAYISNLKLHEF